MKNDKVTIYTDSVFCGNIVKYEGKLIDVGTQKYAQYSNAPYCKFIPTRKRIASGFVKTYKPMLLVLAGVGHPEPPEMFGQADDDGFAQSRHQSHDEAWDTEFDTMIDQYIAAGGVEVIADYRHTKGFNPN